MMYFTHNGVDSRHYGVFLTEHPLILRAERRVEFQAVPGLDGSVPIYDGAYNDVETEFSCYIEDVARLSDAFLWLSAAGDLVLSTDTTRAYHVRVVGEPEVERISRGMAARRLRIPLRLEPFRYHHPAAGAIPLTVSGSAIVNPGTYASRPKIAIAGSGDFTVTVGGVTMEFAGITTGIVVDSEMKDCLLADESALNNGAATMDDFPILPVGASTVSWTGSVTGVTIAAPRWRDL